MIRGALPLKPFGNVAQRSFTDFLCKHIRKTRRFEVQLFKQRRPEKFIDKRAALKLMNGWPFRSSPLIDDRTLSEIILYLSWIFLFLWPCLASKEFH